MPLYRVTARDSTGRLITAEREMTAREARAARTRLNYEPYSAVKVVPVRRSKDGKREHLRHVPAGLSLADYAAMVNAEHVEARTKPYVGGY